MSTVITSSKITVDEVDTDAIDSPKIVGNDIGPRIRGLICKYVSDTTIDINITGCRYRGFETTLDVTWDSEAATAIGLNAWDDDGKVMTTSKSEHFIWLLQKDSDGTLAVVAAYNKTAPDITDSAFDGYSVVTLLTHFYVDSGDAIHNFYKRGNVFHYLAGTVDKNTGLYIGISSTNYLAPTGVDLANGMPYINGDAIYELDSWEMHVRVASATYQPMYFGWASENLDINASNKLICRGFYHTSLSSSPVIIGNMPFGGQTMYIGSSNPVDKRIYVFAIQYNNIQGY